MVAANKLINRPGELYSYRREIIKYFMRTSKGIKATAGHFSISKTYVGCVITEFKKKHNIR